MRGIHNLLLRRKMRLNQKTKGGAFLKHPLKLQFYSQALV